MSNYKMKIVICGKSGLVGSKLEKFFLENKNEVLGLKVRDDTQAEELFTQIDGCDVLINLSGTSILARWSETYKQSLYSSRINTTKKLVDAMALCKEKPKLFLSASAVGIYDSFNKHDENSHNYADDFLSKLCLDWEKEAQKAMQYGVRSVQTRFGVVYAKEGGALQKMITPFRFGLGGRIGDGKQMISWIHVDDLVKMFEFAIKTPELNGVINCTSPEPISNKKQTQIMGKVLKRTTFFTVPPFMLKLMFGEGSRVMLDSKEVYPAKLLRSGFVFKYTSFEDAMKNLIL